jgi:hypothetical protein
LSFFRGLKLLLTLKCDHASHLMSDSFERDLGAWERWAVRMHQVSCRYCRRLAQQLCAIQQAAQARGREAGQLSADARARISKAIATRPQKPS